MTTIALEPPPADPPPTPVPAQPTRSARLWAAPLAVHLAAYLLLLLALVPFARPGVATPDEGAYALQARLVAAGHWEDDQPLAELDPEGRYQPIVGATEAGGRWFPYIKHPLVPTLLGGLMWAFGEAVAVAALPMLGALVAAAAGWILAAELDRRWARGAFWLVALGPVLFNAYVTWAHSFAAALAGLAFVALVRLVRRTPTVGASVGLAAALSAGALVRSESVLYAGAVLAVLAAVAARRRSAPLAVAALGAGGGLAVSLLGERLWVSRILGGAAPRDLVVRSTEQDPGYLAGRLEGIWRSTLQGPTPARVALIVAVLVVAAVVVTSPRRHDASAGVSMAMLGLGVAVVWFADPLGLTPGLLAAAPVLAIGGACAVRARVSGLGLVTGVVGVFALAVYLTQYADGGAFQWGGRFLSPAVVPLSVLAVAGLRSVAEGRSDDRRRELSGCIALLVAACAVSAVGSLGANRAGLAPLYASAAAEASPVNVTTSDFLPRMMWREDLPWLVATEAQLPGLLDQLRRVGVERVTVVARPERVRRSAARWGSAEDRGRLGTTNLEITVLRR